jgi:hypothetical protein
MARNILVDIANIFTAINKGNQTAAQQLLALRSGGATLYYDQKGYDEAVTNNRDGAANRQTLQDLGFQLAPPGSPALRADFATLNSISGRRTTIQDGASFQPNPDPSSSQTTVMVESKGIGNMRDASIAATAYANGFEIFSLDGGFASPGKPTELRVVFTKQISANAGEPAIRGRGLQVAPESLTAYGSREPNMTADANLGRRLLGLGAAGTAERGEMMGPMNTGTPGMSRMPLDIEGMGIIIRNGNSKISMQNAGGEAMQAYMDKKGEIARLRRQYPGYPVLLSFYFQFQPGVNLDFADTWKFEELTVSNSLTGSGVIYAKLPRGEDKVFTAVLPALNPSARPQEPPDQPTTPLDSWTARYRMVKNAYQTGMPPYEEAFHILNGSSMPDILYICDQLDNDRLLMLFQNLLPSAPGLGAGEQRLLAAIVAVRNASTVGYGYTFGTAEMGKLNPDQQHDIREFIASKKLAGKWRVSVDRWQWIYQFATPTKPPVFDSERTVRWTDPSNNQTGAGVWSLSTDMKLVTFAWAGSSTKEEWNMPVDTRNETGRSVMKTGAYSVTAVKM